MKKPITKWLTLGVILAGTTGTFFPNTAKAEEWVRVNGVLYHCSTSCYTNGNGAVGATDGGTVTAYVNTKEP